MVKLLKMFGNLTDHYQNIKLDKFIVMPNHIHGIIILMDMDDVGAGLKPAPTDLTKYYPLSEIIRAFKTFSARHVNELRKTPGIPVWQRNYHEHIVRNENELNRIREYIMNNPLRWQYDRENPDNINVGVGLKPTPRLMTINGMILKRRYLAKNKYRIYGILCGLVGAGFKPAPTITGQCLGLQ